MNLKYSLILLSLNLISIKDFGQKNFDVKILFTKNIDLNKIKLRIDNGKTEIFPESKINKNQIVINGTYYSKYAEILIYYPRPNSSHFLYSSTFFVQSKPAVIEFYNTDTTSSPLKNYSLINARDFKKEKIEMAKYDSSELKSEKDYMAKYKDKIFNGRDTAITNEFLNLDANVYKKGIKYIINNGNSYYAFSFFRRNIVRSSIIPVDSILFIFNTAFPDSFKNSEEGNTIKKLIVGRINVRKNDLAPNFVSKDVNGDKVSLASFRDKNYVLLNFWATWCGPCIAEMPNLKQIKNKYESKGLKIISVAYVSSEEKFLKAIEENKMNWINIYNDADLINAYGGEKAIPLVYLIDKSGKIIYDSSADDSEDNKMPHLAQLLAGLLNEK